MCATCCVSAARPKADSGGGTNKRSAPPVLSKRGRCVMQADTPELVTLAKKQARKPGVAQLRRVRQYGLEHGLQITGRARDDAQHFSGRRLLPRRFGTFRFQIRSG